MLKYIYSPDGMIIGRVVDDKYQMYLYDRRGQLLQVSDMQGNVAERYVYDPAGNILSKTVNGKTTSYAYDKANQLVSSTTDGKVTEYAYDAAGRLIKEGDKSYVYGWLDKVLSVTENGLQIASFNYHNDGQIAQAIHDGKSEKFLWDELALIHRGENSFINEPYVTGGNPILSSKNGVMFNDMLGSTLNIGGKAISMTSFGESADTNIMYTGKPYIGELGYAFLFRNYRSEYGKWQTADPLGYPDGWNNFAYCNNWTSYAIDYNGLWTIQIGITFSGGGAVGGTTSVGIALGYSSDSGFSAGFYQSAGGGSEVGAGGSVTGTLSISGAGAVDALAGTAIVIGGSGGEGVVIGGDVNIPTDITQIENSSASFSIGFGAGTPAEMHTYVTQTFIQQIIGNGGTVTSLKE